jgi:hypothetical protein
MKNGPAVIPGYLPLFGPKPNSGAPQDIVVGSRMPEVVIPYQYRKPTPAYGFLPQVKLSEFTSFIQIRFGNRQIIGKLNT